MQQLIDAALADPWRALETVLDGPLHPGGVEGTEALLDRAGVEAGTRVLDVGCGPGDSLSLARERGAAAVGLDRDPPEGGVRGDLTRLPIRGGSVDVVLAECVLCFVDDRPAALGEVGRVLTSDGRLALSDVVVDGAPPDVPDAVAGPLGLSDPRSREGIVADLEAAGFAVADVREHREALLAMRDRLQANVDYEAILGLLGERGRELLGAIHDLEAAVEDGRVGYVSVVADPA